MCLIENISVYTSQYNVYLFFNNMRLVTDAQLLIIYQTQRSFSADFLPSQYFYRTFFQFAKVFLISNPIF